jgi:hypothetical protein
MRKKSYQTLRPIVIRFIYHRDLAYVLENAKTINQQFPLEIENKRKQLYPVMKEAHENGHFTGMVRDKLYIDNNLYTTKKRCDRGHKCKGSCSDRPAVHSSEPPFVSTSRYTSTDQFHPR